MGEIPNNALAWASLAFALVTVVLRIAFPTVKVEKSSFTAEDRLLLHNMKTVQMERSTRALEMHAETQDLLHSIKEILVTCKKS